MSDLETAKARIARDFIGRSGIHAVGMSRAKGAVKIYVDGEPPGLEQVVSSIRAAIAPIPLIVVRSERASTEPPT
jgi:hypothetical protein